MAQPILEVKDLIVEFPQRRGILRALDGVSLCVGPGEILGLVGESGAGKSMTGSAVIGLLDPPGRITSGEVWVRGEQISGEYLGRAVVRLVKPDRAVAELVKEFSRGIVQRGDRVTTRLKS